MGFHHTLKCSFGLDTLWYTWFVPFGSKDLRVAVARSAVFAMERFPRRHPLYSCWRLVRIIFRFRTCAYLCQCHVAKSYVCDESWYLFKIDVCDVWRRQRLTQVLAVSLLGKGFATRKRRSTSHVLRCFIFALPFHTNLSTTRVSEHDIPKRVTWENKGKTKKGIHLQQLPSEGRTVRE